MRLTSELFRGAAPYYARYMIPFPEDFFRSLVRVCRLSDSSRALDLGAGTGQIGIPLARSIANVLSVDPSEEMIREGKRAAERLGVKNIEFLVSRSEDLDEPKSSFDIAAIANSFQYMDRGIVLAKLAKILKPDGCVAIISRKLKESEPREWYDAMLCDIKEFWGGRFPTGPEAFGPVQTVSSREVLCDSDFRELTKLRHYYEHEWNIDHLLGYLYATSVAAPGTLGPRFDEFTTRIRRLLLSYSPSGVFMERGHITTLLGYRP
ncbi:class I SAM-dependent methyltransferase [Bradyrhizobium genosp. SA-3]|uniref:class I SAM-dependent methyltransferase n=1 Tax=Bradyrhizobium genosp. SA-3 TaxID=508868 RepID=UPI001029920F|nr:class I SAM-dependent methyltransferase [Bradyrhizobium genosp. SA-3]RZN06375.1 class I SAM-dependent methyltransferase [Bradyrhizobium genosp. SA-3]